MDKETNFMQVVEEGEEEMKLPPIITTSNKVGGGSGGGIPDECQDMCEHYWMPYETITEIHTAEEGKIVTKVYCTRCLKIKKI